MALRLFANCGIVTNLARSSFSCIRNMGFFSKAVKIKESPFVIVRATPADTCDILDLMWEAYYPDEPTTSALHLGRTRNSVFDDRAMKIISKGYSLVARCKYNGCLSGVALNDSTCPWDPEDLEKFACTLKCKKMAQLYMFYAYLQKAPDLWKKCCTPQIFEVCMVFVKPDDRRKGLAKRLIDQARNVGVDMSFQVIRVDATNKFTADICEKLKFRNVYELQYCSYVGDDFEPIFKTNPPHDKCITYIHTPGI